MEKVELKTDPAFGSFKSWLLKLTQWRVLDQFRKRKKADNRAMRSITSEMVRSRCSQLLRETSDHQDAA